MLGNNQTAEDLISTSPLGKLSFQYSPMQILPVKTKTNVVIFGETGVGKSSIVNMLSAKDVAKTSNGTKGCTFHSTAYDIDVLGRPMTLHDTAGLDEGEAGHIPKAEAIVQLYKLIRSLSDGVSLLMFVMRAPRIKDSAAKNWQFFSKIICQGQVPAVIVVTGLELEEDMDKW